MNYFTTNFQKDMLIGLRNHPIMAVILSSLFLSSCAGTQTPYSAAQEVGDVGYSTSKLSEDRYRITYTGASNSPLERVQDYALLRAAELTLEQNHSRFEVVDRTTSPIEKENGGAAAELEFRGAPSSQTRCGLLTCTTTQTSPGFTQTRVDLPQQRTYFVATLEILLRDDEQEGSSNIYNAREVVSSVRTGP